MNVEQLRRLLDHYPSDMMVLVNGYEGDYEELLPTNVKPVTVHPKGYKSDYFGDWEQHWDSDEEPPVQAVALERD